MNKGFNGPRLMSSMTNPLKNKKVVIPTIMGLGFLAIFLTVLSPVLAQVQSTDNQTPQITGSVNIKQTMKDYIKEHQKTSFSEASSIAQKEVTNGSVIGGHIGIVQGYLVYNFIVIDTENDKVYSVTVDAGNGKVLEKSDGKDLKEFGGMFGSFGHGQFGHESFDRHAFGGKWMQHQDMNNPDAQSSGTQ